MNILGIPLRRPTFTQLTWSAAIATLWWIAVLGAWRLAGGEPDIVDAGASLLMIFWGVISPRCGIRVDQGGIHFAAMLFAGALMLAAFQAMLTIVC